MEAPSCRSVNIIGISSILKPIFQAVNFISIWNAYPLNRILSKINGFKHLFAITFKTGCCIVNFHSRNKPDVFGSEIRHQYPAHGPVHHINTRYITGTDCQVSPLRQASCSRDQIIGIVRKIGIHLENVVIVTLQCPFETCNISGSQSQFSFTLDKVQTVGLFTFCFIDFTMLAVPSGDPSSIISTSNSRGRGKDGVDHLFDILFFVVCRDNYERFFHDYLG